jgi:hypothetical protein
MRKVSSHQWRDFIERIITIGSFAASFKFGMGANPFIRAEEGSQESVVELRK